MRNLGTAAAIAAVCTSAAGPALAQSQTYQDLYAFYSLWGMMEATANFCFDTVDYDPSYMMAGEGWKQDNLFLRDEADAALAASGESPALSGEGEEAGRQLVQMIASSANPREACMNWLANTQAGMYFGETYLAEQFGRLRERDGL